jgi:hypothetical protein
MTEPETKQKQPLPETPETGKILSPEEQMEQFEEDLKENDWGHQPC